MVESYLRSGRSAPASFNFFVRPARERPWYVAAGTHRMPQLLEESRNWPRDIEYLRGLGFEDETLRWLEDLEPTEEIFAVEEPDG